MILLSKTYEVVTEESAENGEAEDQGFEWEGVPHTFRELVDMLKHEYRYPSCSPTTGDTHTWFSTEPDLNFRTGETTTYSLHYGRENEPRSAKYWAKAMRAAGLLK